jgi:hypothetical protein
MPDAGARPIDVTLVSGRRPELLRRTLASFDAGLFSRFRIGRFIANLDPIFGDASDHAACLGAIRERFPEAEVFEPKAAGFGAAVKRIWAATTAALVFHLEDDWALNEAIDPARIAALMTGTTRAVALVSREMGWNGSDAFNRRRKKVRVLGIPVRSQEFEVFGTSPRFLEGDFARRCAALMDPDLDPEKQMRPPGNRALISFLQAYRCRFLTPTTGDEVITDIGREWRDARGIEKVVAKGESHWIRRDE